MVSGALLATLSPAPDDAASPAPSVRDAAAARPGGDPAGGRLSLARAVEIALEQNFTLLNASDSVSRSRMQETVARAQFFPKLVPSYGQSADGPNFGLEARQKLPFTGGSISASAGYRSALEDGTPFPRTTDARLTLTQPLLRGFGPNAAHHELRNSRRGREGRERSLELTRQQVAIDVTSAFYQVVLQRQLMAVARQSLKRAESLLQASEARLAVGLVSKLDVFRAELLAAQAQEAMVQAETSLQTELERFRARLGLAATAAVEPDDVELPEEITMEPLEPVEVLVQKALAARLDLAEARDGVGDAERNASLARQNLLPQVDLNLAMTQLGFGTTFSSAWKSGVSDRRFTVFLSTSYPLERSSEAANRATAELDVEASRRTLRQRQLDIEAEVRGAVRQIERLGKSIELQKKAVDIAEQQRQLATLRYQRGLASNFDVVDAEGSLVLARSALVGLLTSHRLARYELLRATGTLDVEREFLQ
jgi:outer membrane protein TolC